MVVGLQLTCTATNAVRRKCRCVHACRHVSGPKPVSVKAALSHPTHQYPEGAYPQGAPQTQTVRQQRGD